MQESVGVSQVSKITDLNDENPFYVWGQDRMWLIKEEIYKRISG